MSSAAKYTALIKQKAHEQGFLHCGISKADFLSDEAPKLEEWLRLGYQGSMSYMERNFDKRLDPRLLVDGAKSVVTLIYNYFPAEKPRNTDALKISKYAYGEDYHVVIKDKLFELMAYLQQEIGEVSGRVFVDSAPVMDKAWAKKSGAGWIGKHTNLVRPGVGSFFFIAELIIDLDLIADGPIKDYCGTCTRCIDACPTEAIVAPYQLDGSKCISYLTIELKDAVIDGGFKGKMDNWMFGCDACQDVCPWNRFSKPHTESRFNPSDGLLEMTTDAWVNLTEEVFTRYFKSSAVSRTKFSGLQRNIRFLTGE
jgi:epoxyqueuosine reductase